MCQIIACFILTILSTGDYVKFVLIKVREWPIFCMSEGREDGLELAGSLKKENITDGGLSSAHSHLCLQ